MNLIKLKMNRIYYQEISAKRRALFRMINRHFFKGEVPFQNRFELFESISDLTIKLSFLEYLIAADLSIRDFAEKEKMNYQKLMISFSEPFIKLEVHQTETIVSTINKEISIDIELNKLNHLIKKEG